MRAGVSDSLTGSVETKRSTPGTCPHKTESEIVELLIAARHDHPTWGPKKLKAWLEATTPWDLELPAPSTIGSILKRAGLVAPRKRRRRPSRATAVPHVDSAPNDIWTTDFKGHFRLGNGRYCYPLTLIDSFSRLLLRCDGYKSPDSSVALSFESAFIEFVKSGKRGDKSRRRSKRTRGRR
jgi:transposase InsO family protein